MNFFYFLAQSKASPEAFSEDLFNGLRTNVIGGIPATVHAFQFYQRIYTMLKYVDRWVEINMFVLFEWIHFLLSYLLSIELPITQNNTILDSSAGVAESKASD